MNEQEEKAKTQSEKKYELASAWSVHMLSALNSRLEKEVNKDLEIIHP